MTAGGHELPGGRTLQGLRAAIASVPGYLTVLAAVLTLYVLFAKAGLQLALFHPSATAVWAPTGIAFAVFLLLGFRVWPAIVLGAFAANITTQGNALTSAVIALGNTAEGIIGAWLVQRFADGARVVSCEREPMREPPSHARWRQRARPG